MPLHCDCIETETTACLIFTSSRHHMALDVFKGRCVWTKSLKPGFERANVKIAWTKDPERVLSKPNAQGFFPDDLACLRYVRYYCKKMWRSSHNLQWAFGGVLRQSELVNHFPQLDRKLEKALVMGLSHLDLSGRTSCNVCPEFSPVLGLCQISSV